MTIEKFILEILCLVGMTLGIRLYNKNDSSFKKYVLNVLLSISVLYLIEINIGMV